MQTSFKYGPGEEFFTQTDRDSAVVKKHHSPTIGPSQMQLNANVDGTGPEMDSGGMDKATNMRLRDVNNRSVLL